MFSLIELNTAVKTATIGKLRAANRIRVNTDDETGVRGFTAGMIRRNRAENENQTVFAIAIIEGKEYTLNGVSEVAEGYGVVMAPSADLLPKVVKAEGANKKVTFADDDALFDFAGAEDTGEGDAPDAEIESDIE